MTRIILALVCAACSSGANASPGPAPGSGSNAKDAPSARFEHDMLVRFHMHQNFDLLRGVERLLLRGKLGEARDLARAMASTADEPGMPLWTTELAAVREQATALANAGTIDKACGIAAKLASACGSCHVATGATPEFAAPPAAPPDRPTLDARMARHRWAADRLWEGMVGRADDSWLVGIDVLAATPLPAEKLGAAREGLARQLQRLADRARMTSGTEQDRTTVYGELLATCAGCHTTRPTP